MQIANTPMTPELRRTPPKPLSGIPFDIPRPSAWTLDNGLRVVVFANERIPLVSYRLAFRTGEAHDPVDGIGLTASLAAMLTEGTRTYTSRQLAEKVERLGASLSASTSEDFTILAASALSLYSSEILHLLAEITHDPTFPESELDLYRRNTVEHLKFQRSQPGFLAGEQAGRLIYGRHPYGRMAPKAEDIEKLSRERLLSFHRERFIPNNAILMIVGDVDIGSIRKEVEELFAEWQPGTVPSSDFASPPSRHAKSLTIVDRPGSAQSNIVISNLGIKRTHADYFPLLVMNQVLGAGASSRVFMNLREEKGYTYGAYTRLGTKMLSGDFEATAEVRTAVTGDSLREFFFEFDRIRGENVEADELGDAKNFLTGVFPLRAETQEGLTNLIVNQHLYDLPADYLQTYRNEVDAVTSEDLMRVAGKHLRPDEMAIVIVGDAEEVLPQAQSYAESLEIYDTDGAEQDPARYRRSEFEQTADAAGKWSLSIDFQGQQLPVTLKVEQQGDAFTGVLETMLGNGKISDGKIAGKKVSATATAEMQGQQIEFVITGKVEGDAMNGTLAAPIVPEPLTFNGTRGS